MVAREITLNFEAAPPPADRGLRHAHLRVQPGRRASSATPVARGRLVTCSDGPGPPRRRPVAVHLGGRIHHGTPSPTVMDGRNAMLAIAMNGQALPSNTGPGPDGRPRPVRLRFGHQVGHRHRGDHVRRGVRLLVHTRLVAAAPIKTESRIDVPNSAVQAGRTRWQAWPGPSTGHRRGRGPGGPGAVAAGHAGRRPGIDTWRQWVWEWDAAPGTHTIEARATDATGYTQTRSAGTARAQRRVWLPKRHRPGALGTRARIQPVCSNWSRAWPDR